MRKALTDYIICSETTLRFLTMLKITRFGNLFGRMYSQTNYDANSIINRNKRQFNKFSNAQDIFWKPSLYISSQNIYVCTIICIVYKWSIYRVHCDLFRCFQQPLALYAGITLLLTRTSVYYV